MQPTRAGDKIPESVKGQFHTLDIFRCRRSM
jgi:hypothetical protein